MSLRDIAATTKISITALEALERGDFSRLPGGIFSRAFVRSYAVAVGLDPEVTVREFVEEMTESENQASSLAILPEVTAEDRQFLERQRLAALIVRIVLVVIAVAIVVLIGWKLRGRWAH